MTEEDHGGLRSNGGQQANQPLSSGSHTSVTVSTPQTGAPSPSRTMAWLVGLGRSPVSTPAVDRDLAACRSRTQGGHRMIILGCGDVKGSSGGRGPQRSGSAMAGMLDELLGRVAARFPRIEPRRRVREFVLGLLADLPRKNCWAIPSTPGRPAPMARSLCSVARCGAPTGCVMICATTSWSTLVIPPRCWWSMRPRISRRVLPRSELSGSPPGPRVGSRTPRSRCISDLRRAGRARDDRPRA